MNIPEISIIVPIYKAERFLKQCIESILKQTFKNFELILINDGSPDNSSVICDEYAKQDPRIVVIHKENEGVSETRNIGIKKSRGRYIMFADADDFVEPTWCEDLYLQVNNTNSFVISDFYIHNYRKGNRFRIKREIENFKTMAEIEKKDFIQLYLNRFLNTLWNKIYDSKIVKENNLTFEQNLSLGEDLLFNLSYLEKCGNKILIIHKPLYHYILRDEESLDNKYYDNLFEIYNKLYSELLKSMKLFGTELETYHTEFFTSYFHLLNRALENTFHEKSKLTFAQKIIYNTKILRSNEFTNCLQYGDLNEFNKKYISLLKCRSYLFVYIFQKLSLVIKDISTILKLRLPKKQL